MTDEQIFLDIDLATQTLLVRRGSVELFSYPVSTACNGPGEKADSGCTPRGEHAIAEKIGADQAVNTVFVARKPSGEIYTPGLRLQFPERDWILTRVLWLRGLQPDINLGGDVDSHARYIYIHGAPDEVAMGIPGSAGCVRMRNRDIVELFDMVQVGTRVNIRE